MHKKGIAWLIGLLLLGLRPFPIIAQTTPTTTIIIQPGDTWAALALRFQVTESALHELNPHPNPLRQPAIGTELVLPETAVEQSGILHGPGGIYGQRPLLSKPRRGKSLYAMSNLPRTVLPCTRPFLYLPKPRYPANCPPGLAAWSCLN
ncbi:MAG: LysM peptidoglycan-binding domain-containing protein [Ardenticatenaceae bacterium]|nr:LysM peptidoglycan-binding domain-containing protein [Ardenticatenaceae bacterium]